MSRVNVYSGPYQRHLHGYDGIVRQRLAALGYDAYYDPSTGYDTFDPSTLMPVSGDGAPTLGPTDSGGFTPGSSGALIGPILTNPNATLAPLTPAQQAQVATTYIPPTAAQYGTVNSAILNPSTANTISNAIATALTPTPRPSPVVNVPLSASTAGMWIQNNMSTVLLVAAVAGAALLLGGRRR